MPRGPRIDFPGAIHHVYARGIEKRDVFLDDADRFSLLDRVGRNLAKCEMRCFAWALLPNHFHFLLQSDTGRLPSFMHCLLTGYSKYFNERYGRVGHLFQNRYKSSIVGKAGYFRDLVRYIHLNPLRSGIVRSVAELEEYPWTGHRRVVRGGNPEWQDTSLLRIEFNDDASGSGWIRNYLDYVEGVPDITGKSDSLGTFADLVESGRGLPEDSTGPFEVLSDLLRQISERHGVPVEEVLAGDRKYAAVQVRRNILEIGKSRLGISIAQMSRWMGIKENAAWYLLNSNKQPKKVL